MVRELNGDRVSALSALTWREACHKLLVLNLDIHNVVGTQIFYDFDSSLEGYRGNLKGVKRHIFRADAQHGFCLAVRDGFRERPEIDFQVTSLIVK